MSIPAAKPTMLRATWEAYLSVENSYILPATVCAALTKICKVEAEGLTLMAEACLIFVNQERPL